MLAVPQTPGRSRCLHLPQFPRLRNGNHSPDLQGWGGTRRGVREASETPVLIVIVTVLTRKDPARYVTEGETEAPDSHLPGCCLMAQVGFELRSFGPRALSLRTLRGRRSRGAQWTAPGWPGSGSSWPLAGA